MHISAFGGLGERGISELESRLGVSLPVSYRKFLTETGGGTVRQDGRNRVVIPSTGREIAIDVFFGYGVGKNSDILYWTDMFRDEIFRGAVLIGFDTRQGYIFLVPEEGGGVYYWDDAYTFEESDDSQNVYFICEDFSVFGV